MQIIIQLFYILTGCACMFGVANHTLKILNDLHSNVQYTYIYMIQ